MDNVKNNITFLKKKKGETQDSIALYVKKAKTTVSGWENGVSEPGVKELILLSEFFEVSLDDLINKDLSNVHLNNENKDLENEQNVHPNVHGNVHPNTKKAVLFKVNDAPAAVVNEGESGYLTSQNLIAALQETVEAQKALNAHLVQQVATLNEQITKLKTKKSSKAP